ncbi:TonB-linked SusC/RagA family outer membrane protein [Lacibacter cauensis]|uniref:TonB-linked SusC/RagA family outer membrane protein n=1 Tax=Lacibacter cauensis TaxID=510947 RepID=A0A562SE49_9BACT|nr:SusC/RagA family TonB-linked outer membrane protein [Lacibacter cauensis]TWI79194.1 TonB-linked SusC/RagA family outer membrane protein [Lacibacter cauensis]
MKKRMILSATAQKLIVGAFLFSFIGNASAQSDTTSASLKGDSVQMLVTNGIKVETATAGFKEISFVPLRYALKQPVISLQQIVKGNAAGVHVQEPSGEPGSEQNVFIRGISSPLLSKRELFDQQAAIFLNGIPLAQDNPFAYEIQKYDFNRIGPATNLLAAISPDNIESIEIIKDPVTLAALGPVAANGAIWITTKNAHSGYREITVNSYYGYAMKPSYTPVNAAYENNFRKPFYDRFGTIADRLNYPPYLRDSTNADYYGPANWGDKYFDNAALYNLDLSLTGGSERANFRFFGSATKNASSADRTAINRYTGSFFINAAPIKWLMVSSMLNYNRLERTRNRNIRDRLAEQRYIPDLTNPLTPNKNLYSAYLNEFNKVIDNNTSNVIQGYFALSANLNKFSYRGRIAFDYNEGIRDVFWPTTLLEKNNFVSNYFGYNQRMVVSNTATYQIDVNRKQKLMLEAGQNFMADTYKYDYAYAYNGPNDFVKINVVNGATGSDYLLPAAFRVYYFPSKMRSALASFSGKATYSFDDVVKLHAVVSRDGSSNMQPDNRWTTNFSGGVEWDVKKQYGDALTNMNAFTVNASWARLGRLLNDDRFNAGAQYRVDMGWGNEPTLGSYAGIPGISRPYTSGWVGYGIPWARSEQSNLAVRMAFLNSNLKFGIDVYNREDKQMLLPVPVPTEWGYTGAYKSGLHVRNNGIDFTMFANILPAENHRISWSISSNFNYNRNKLVGLPGGLNELIIGNNKLVVGKRIDAFWLLKNFGTYKRQSQITVNPQTGVALNYRGVPVTMGDPWWLDLNNDFRINDEDKLVTGNYLPKVTGGFSTTLAYKAFTLDMQFYTALGHQVLNQYASSRLDFINVEASNNINSVKEITFWQKKMDLSGYPMYNPWSSVVPYRLDQSLFLDNASFLKLRSVTLSYELAKANAKQKSLRSCVFYITGTNLLTITSFKGDDPELVNYNGIYTGYGLPLSRTVIAGVRIEL